MKQHNLRVRSKGIESDKEIIFAIIETNKHFDVSWYVNDEIVDHDSIEKDNSAQTIDDLIKILELEGLEVEKL